MEEEKCEQIMQLFTRSFGIPGQKGEMYLGSVLHKCDIILSRGEKHDYLGVYNEVAREHGVTDKSVLHTIQKYLERGWQKQLIRENWTKLTDWDKNYLPNPETAIIILLDAYPEFEKIYCEELAKVSNETGRISRWAHISMSELKNLVSLEQKWNRAE